MCGIKAPQVDPTLPEYGDLPHVSGENIESGTGRLLEVRSAADDGMTSGKYLFESGDVLYSKFHPPPEGNARELPRIVQRRHVPGPRS